MQHFYDSFALVSQICVRRDALELFGLNDDELLPDLHITRAGVLRAELGAHQEHVVDQDAHAADRKKVPAPVIHVASHEVDTYSDKDESIIATSDCEESDSARESEQNELPSSLASDSEQYERMQAAYTAVGRDFKDKEAFIGSEYHKLQGLEVVPQRWPLARLSIPLQKSVDHLGRSTQHVQIVRNLSLPTTWPLARLMFPICDLVKQMETLLQTYCFEIAVTCAEAREKSAYVRRMALHLGQYLAIFLAETITGLFQKVLTHPAQGLVDETNAALLTQKFWVQAIYTELLCASSLER